jgi:hypothetical protein
LEFLLIDLDIDRAKAILEYLRGHEKSQLYHSPILWGHIKALEAAIESPPDMYWNHDDPDRCHDSIYDVLEDLADCGSLKQGAIIELQRAYKAPNIKVRVTHYDPNEEAYRCEYEATK